MITYAEAFETMQQAKERWAVLERRQEATSDSECIIVSGWLNNAPHVLLVATGLPDGFLDNPTGRVHQDVDPIVWLKLWARHEQRRVRGDRARIVERRPANVGIRL